VSVVIKTKALNKPGIARPGNKSVSENSLDNKEELISEERLNKEQS